MSVNRDRNWTTVKYTDLYKKLLDTIRQYEATVRFGNDFDE